MTDKIPYADETFSTNIKNLPAGRRYFTELAPDGYTYPWVEIARTTDTVTVARVLTTPDPDWKPAMEAGVFVAHCANQDEQAWLFDIISEVLEWELRVVKSQYPDRDYAWGRKGVEFVENRAREFYNYNFQLIKGGARLG